MALITEIQVHDSATVWNDEQRAEILAESLFILSQPSFKNSKRCTKLFQFVIEHALAGDRELKERTLGVEVFGRNPGYDTNADPIVRMTASEIRKRLAQYYQQEEYPGRIRIRIVPGSYIPQFEIVVKEMPDASLEQISVENAAEDAQKHAKLKVALLSMAWKNRLRRWLLVGGVSLCALTAVFAGWLVLAPHFVSTQELIWAPLIHESGPAMLCVSDGYSVAGSGAGIDWAAGVLQLMAARKFEPPPLKDRPAPAVPVVDAKVAARVMTTLIAHRHETIMRETSATTLADLGRGPAVLVGAFDNSWFLALLSHQRLHVMVDPVAQDHWIEDAWNPGRREWKINSKAQFSDSSVDYALISRVHSTETGTWILGIGGLGLHATEAAGALVTDPNLSKLLPACLRDTQKNFQIVIKTVVINGNSGPPQVVASYVW
jgi:hypothetical protein